jgi:serine/threonine-protein kinase HipA
MRWLKAAGIAVPQIRLIPAADIPELPTGVAKPNDPVYVVERFDRAADGRVHVEDFAQVADVDPMFKYRDAGVTYDGIAAVLLRISGVPAYEEYLRRLVAMVITGNTDAHLKNWAVIYPDGRTAHISPAFDFHSLSVYQAYRYTPMALILGGEEVAAAVTLDNFRRLADVAGTDVDRTVELVDESIEAMRLSWATEIREEATKRFPALAEHYENRLTSLALVRT